MSSLNHVIACFWGVFLPFSVTLQIIRLYVIRQWLAFKAITRRKSEMTHLSLKRRSCVHVGDRCPQMCARNVIFTSHGED